MRLRILRILRNCIKGFFPAVSLLRARNFVVFLILENLIYRPKSKEKIYSYLRQEKAVGGGEMLLRKNCTSVKFYMLFYVAHPYLCSSFYHPNVIGLRVGNILSIGQVSVILANLTDVHLQTLPLWWEKCSICFQANLRMFLIKNGKHRIIVRYPIIKHA